MQTSIDHYIPKSERPQWAYQWNNFRLCRTDLNTNKGRTMYVVDPFGIQNGWFEIDFTTFRIKASNVAPQLAINPIRVTIEVLRLNDDTYVEERLNATALYVHKRIDKLLFADLKRVLPSP